METKVQVLHTYLYSVLTLSVDPLSKWAMLAIVLSYAYGIYTILADYLHRFQSYIIIKLSFEAQIVKSERSTSTIQRIPKCEMIAFQYEAGSTTLLCSNIFPSKVPIYTENELCQKKIHRRCNVFQCKKQICCKVPKKFKRCHKVSLLINPQSMH